MLLSNWCRVPGFAPSPLPCNGNLSCCKDPCQDRLFKRATITLQRHIGRRAYHTNMQQELQGIYGPAINWSKAFVYYIQT
jgi:hypothetical protein